MSQADFPSAIHDVYGRKYLLREENSHSGGQGIMFQYEDYALKLLFQKDDELHTISKSEKEYKKYQASLVRLMALPALPHLSMPIVGLESPYCGYVMRFMQGLSSLEFLLEKPQKGQMLSAFPYSKGSLKKRYNILKNLSDVLRSVHNAGLVYCDLTPNNIFVSKDDAQAEAWLIDVDNLCYANEASETWQTPWYRSPELFRGESKNSIESDCYSFAIIAFQLLTLSKPFEGTEYAKLEDDVGWDDEDAWDSANPTVQESRSQRAAEGGELSYVGEPKTINKQKFGIPLQYVTTEQIRELFLRTLGPEGRKNPSSRPSMNEWFHAFDAACDLLICCNDGHYHFGDKCYLCGNNAPNGSYCRVTFSRVVLLDIESNNHNIKEIKFEGSQKWTQLHKKTDNMRRRNTAETVISIPWKWFPGASMRHNGESAAFDIVINQTSVSVKNNYDPNIQIKIVKEALPALIRTRYCSDFDFELTIEEV